MEITLFVASTLLNFLCNHSNLTSKMITRKQFERRGSFKSTFHRAKVHTSIGWEKKDRKGKKSS